MFTVLSNGVRLFRVCHRGPLGFVKGFPAITVQRLPTVMSCEEDSPAGARERGGAGGEFGPCGEGSEGSFFPCLSSGAHRFTLHEGLGAQNGCNLFCFSFFFFSLARSCFSFSFCFLFFSRNVRRRMRKKKSLK